MTLGSYPVLDVYSIASRKLIIFPHQPEINQFHPVMSKQIPNPKGYPFIGNVLDVNPDHPQESLAQIAESYGMSISCLSLYAMLLPMFLR